MERLQLNVLLCPFSKFSSLKQSIYCLSNCFSITSFSDINSCKILATKAILYTFKAITFNTYGTKNRSLKIRNTNAYFNTLFKGLNTSPYTSSYEILNTLSVKTIKFFLGHISALENTIYFNSKRLYNNLEFSQS
jgi:hypothetical protein